MSTMIILVDVSFAGMLVNTRRVDDYLDENRRVADFDGALIDSSMDNTIHLALRTVFRMVSLLILIMRFS